VDSTEIAALVLGYLMEGGEEEAAELFTQCELSVGPGIFNGFDVVLLGPRKPYEVFNAADSPFRDQALDALRAVINSSDLSFTVRYSAKNDTSWRQQSTSLPSSTVIEAEYTDLT